MPQGLAQNSLGLTCSNFRVLFFWILERKHITALLSRRVPPSSGPVCGLPGGGVPEAQGTAAVPRSPVCLQWLRGDVRGSARPPRPPALSAAPRRTRAAAPELTSMVLRCMDGKGLRERTEASRLKRGISRPARASVPRKRVAQKTAPRGEGRGRRQTAVPLVQTQILTLKISRSSNGSIYETNGPLRTMVTTPSRRPL